MKIHNSLLPLLGSLILTGCSSFFLGEDNQAAPVDLPTNPSTVNFSSDWKTTVGNGTEDKTLYLKPLVVENVIYAASADGTLVASALSSGGRVWEVESGHSITAGVSGDKNLVVIGSENGLLLSYEASTGKRGWTHQLHSEILAAPTVREGLVVARTTDGHITALDAKSGQVVWKQYIGVADISIRGNSRALFFDGLLLFTNGKGRVSLLRVTDGAPVLNAPVIRGKGATAVDRIVDILSTPVIQNGNLYVSAYRHETVAINLKSGTLLWRSKYGTSRDLYVDASYVYIVDKDSVINALDKSSGEKVWESAVLKGRKISPLNGDTSSIVTVDFDGVMTALSKRDGSVLGYNSVGSGRSYVAPQKVGGKWLTYTSSGDLTLTTMGAR